MIIEDDLDTIELLKVILEIKGYEPIAALGGKRGLELLNAGKQVDLILLDLMMNDIDGWTVLRTLKANNRFGQIPVIILSVRHRLEDLIKTKAHAGMFAGYMVKPFNVRELLTTITQVLDGQDATMEMES